jgi:hypothetical protein
MSAKGRLRSILIVRKSAAVGGLPTFANSAASAQVAYPAILFAFTPVELAACNAFAEDFERPFELAESPGAMFSCALWPYLPPREKA